MTGSYDPVMVHGSNVSKAITVMSWVRSTDLQGIPEIYKKKMFIDLISILSINTHVL